MDEAELHQWMEREYGDVPPPEILDLCHDVACQIKAYVIDTGDWFGAQHIDKVRIMLQSKLLDLACEVVRLDRQSEPNFFGAARERGAVPPDPRPSHKPPPLYRHLMAIRARRNGHGKPERIS